MKKSIALLLAVFLSLISMATAQTHENQQRERDIKIAEGIIAEIFGSRNSQNMVLPSFRSRNVRGEYIPGYGVHFTVSPGHSSFVHIRNLSSDEDEIRVELQQNGNQSGSDSANEEKIKEKILEYITKYAALISGVPDDETIRVTYAPNQTGPATWVFAQNGNQKNTSQSGFSVWASFSDLKQYRNGNISEQQLIDRINTHPLDGNETYTDFNIFASVLETALDNTGAEHLRISGKPQMEYLPGLGVRYRVQVSARASFILNEFNYFDGNYEFKIDSLRLNLEESLNPLILKLDSVVDLDLSDEERERIQKEIREEREVISSRRDSLRSAYRTPGPGVRSIASDDTLELSNEVDAIMDQLLNVIENYGSTLTSLDSEEMLMITINWSGRSEDLPERTEIRIKKTDLLRGEAPDIEEIDRR